MHILFIQKQGHREVPNRSITPAPPVNVVSISNRVEKTDYLRLLKSWDVDDLDVVAVLWHRDFPVIICRWKLNAVLDITQYGVALVKFPHSHGYKRGIKPLIPIAVLPAVPLKRLENVESNRGFYVGIRVQPHVILQIPHFRVIKHVERPERTHVVVAREDLLLHRPGF